MKVAYSREAIGNLRDISAYIRSQNPAAAKTVRHAIRKSAATLGECVFSSFSIRSNAGSIATGES
jgi:plasmid stabilization system protein ParE